MSFERIKHLVERLKQRFDPAEADELRELQEAELQEAVDKEHAAEAAKKAAEEKPAPTPPPMRSMSKSSSEPHQAP